MTPKEYGEYVRMLEKCLPDGFELVFLTNTSHWTVYNPQGCYYGLHSTPEGAIKAAISSLWTRVQAPASKY